MGVKQREVVKLQASRSVQSDNPSRLTDPAIFENLSPRLESHRVDENRGHGLHRKSPPPVACLMDRCQQAVSVAVRERLRQGSAAPWFCWHSVQRLAGDGGPQKKDLGARSSAEGVENIGARPSRLGAKGKPPVCSTSTCGRTRDCRTLSLWSHASRQIMVGGSSNTRDMHGSGARQRAACRNADGLGKQDGNAGLGDSIWGHVEFHGEKKVHPGHRRRDPKDECTHARTHVKTWWHAQMRGYTSHIETRTYQW